MFWTRKSRPAFRFELDSDGGYCSVGRKDEGHTAAHIVEVGVAIVVWLIELNAYRHELGQSMARGEGSLSKECGAGKADDNGRNVSDVQVIMAKTSMVSASQGGFQRVGVCEFMEQHGNAA
jgi:hypothetical protein